MIAIAPKYRKIQALLAGEAPLDTARREFAEEAEIDLDLITILPEEQAVTVESRQRKEQKFWIIFLDHCGGSARAGRGPCVSA
jgi:8-oxo-dGTP pyrophosphatase MutT (NUDIX family)